MLRKRDKDREEGREYDRGWVKQGRERWRIVRRYVGQGVEKILNGLQQWMEEKEEGVRTLVGRTLMRELEGKEGD